MKTITSKFKIALVAVGLLTIGSMSAQTTTQDDTKLVKKTDAAGDAVVRVIDNKGTIKYLQSSNGITTITSTTSGSATTTTWQLGGTLTDSTYIDVSDKIFALDGIALINPTTESASTDATTLSSHGTGTGYTLLVRDEATGATKKLLMSDLVKGGNNNQAAVIATDATYTDATVPNDITKIWVYRNGAKLLAGVDYTISGLVGAVTVTIKNANGSAPEDYAFNTGDRIEVQWIK